MTATALSAVLPVLHAAGVLSSAIVVLSPDYKNPESDQFSIGWTTKHGQSRLYVDTEGIYVKGFFFPVDYTCRFADVADVRENNDVVLRLSRTDLEGGFSGEQRGEPRRAEPEHPRGDHRQQDGEHGRLPRGDSRRRDLYGVHRRSSQRRASPFLAGRIGPRLRFPSRRRVRSQRPGTKPPFCDERRDV